MRKAGAWGAGLGDRERNGELLMFRDFVEKVKRLWRGERISLECGHLYARGQGFTLNGATWCSKECCPPLYRNVVELREWERRQELLTPPPCKGGPRSAFAGRRS